MYIRDIAVVMSILTLVMYLEAQEVLWIQPRNSQGVRYLVAFSVATGSASVTKRKKYEWLLVEEARSVTPNSRAMKSGVGLHRPWTAGETRAVRLNGRHTFMRRTAIAFYLLDHNPAAM